MIEPVRKTVTVPAAPAAAFRRFTAELGTWWPLATHSVAGAESESVEMGEGEGGRLVERGAGREYVWGTVTTWDPPRRVAFTWHPDRDPSSAQEVEVTFEPTDGGTLVKLEHRGWEVLGEEAAAKRADYDQGWDPVLERYARAAVPAP